MLKSEARKPGLPKLTKQNMEDAPEDTKWVESIKSTVNVAVQEIEQVRSSANGIKLLSNADVEMVEVDVQAPDPWIQNPTLLNGWTNVGTPGFAYTKSPDGTVFVQFELAVGAAATAFVMPAGYQPKNRVQFVAFDFTTFVSVPFLIGTSGSFDIGGGGAGDSVVGSVSYLSADTTPVPLSCWPKLVKTRFDKVAAVVVADVVDAETTKPLPAGAVYHPIWELTSSGGFPQVKLLNIAGLPYNRKSRVRLLIFGG